MELILSVASGVVLGGLVLMGMRYKLFWQGVVAVGGLAVMAVAAANWGYIMGYKDVWGNVIK